MVMKPSSNFLKIWLVLALGYFTARLAIRYLIAGVLSLDLETAVLVAIVPLAQAAVLLAVLRLRTWRPRFLRRG